VGLYRSVEDRVDQALKCGRFDTRKPTLAEVKEMLKAKGLTWADYAHLSYKEMRKLAGVE